MKKRTKVLLITGLVLLIGFIPVPQYETLEIDCEFPHIYYKYPSPVHSHLFFAYRENVGCEEGWMTWVDRVYFGLLPLAEKEYTPRIEFGLFYGGRIFPDIRIKIFDLLDIRYYKHPWTHDTWRQFLSIESTVFNYSYPNMQYVKVEP